MADCHGHAWPSTIPAHLRFLMQVNLISGMANSVGCLPVALPMKWLLEAVTVCAMQWILCQSVGGTKAVWEPQM